MGTITLTDRISVSVRAKSNTGGTGGGGSTAQERATGRNAAKALGADPESISDEEAEALFDILNGGDGTGSSGASSSGTSKAITDEQGRQWLPISGVIAAGKRMYANGAFDEKTVHDGLEDGNGNILTVSGAAAGGEIIEEASSWYRTYSIPGGVYYVAQTVSNGEIRCYCFSKEAINITSTKYAKSDGHVIETGQNTGSSTSATVNGVKYSFFIATLSVGSSSSTVNISGGSGGNPSSAQKAGYLFGSTHTTGGSLIDWTKPDDEIEDDIRNLHNTWDVTEHEGSATANGTYILAGPIEYNDADPSSPDPDEEE